VGGPAAKRYYPAFVDLTGRLAVVIGPGELAERKAEKLVSHDADVVVISDSPTERIIELEGEGALTLEQRAYETGDLAGAFLVLCLTSDPDERDRIVAEAEERGSLLNVKGGPTSSNFIAPSVVRRGALQVAVSTGGVVPALARTVRSEIAKEYGPEWERYLDLLAEVRGLLAKRGPAVRRETLAVIVESDVIDRLRAGDELTAAALVAEFAPPAEDADEATDAEGAPAEDVGADETAPDGSDPAADPDPTS